MLKWLLPHIPKSLIWPVASQYIAGETVDQCISKGLQVNSAGHALAIDILGEHSQTQRESDAVVTAYTQLIRQCSEVGLDYGISLKLSHLGTDADVDMSRKALSVILNEAADHGIRLTLDMESTRLTDLILDMYSTHLAGNHLGMALQAYLRRSMGDATRLIADHDPATLHIRVCKGIYKESPRLLVGNRAAINANYIKLAEYLYEHGAYVCIATHDMTLIDHFRSLGWDPSRFEFQALLGVPIREEMDALHESGYKTTVYLPFGPDWHAYSIRRLLENPTLIRYVIKNMFG